MERQREMSICTEKIRKDMYRNKEEKTTQKEIGSNVLKFSSPT